MLSLRSSAWLMALGVCALAFTPSVVLADTPANCSYSGFLGHWTITASAPVPAGTNCSGVAATTSVPGVTLAYPNLARDDAGNIGNWTLVYNQGVEIWIAGRIHFAYSAYNGSESICDRSQVGWSHDADGDNWSCFSAQRDPASETTLTVYADGGNCYSGTSMGTYDFEPDACLASPAAWAPQYPAMTISLDLSNNGWTLSLFNDSQCTIAGGSASGNGASCASTSYRTQAPTWIINTPITQLYTFLQYGNQGCWQGAQEAFGVPVGRCNQPHVHDAGVKSTLWTVSGQNFKLEEFSDAACQESAGSPTTGQLDDCQGGWMLSATPLPASEDAPIVATDRLQRVAEVSEETQTNPITQLKSRRQHAKITLTEDEFESTAATSSTSPAVYRLNPEFLAAINAAQSHFTVRAYPELEGQPLDSLTRRRGGKADLRSVSQMLDLPVSKPKHHAPDLAALPTEWDWRNVSGQNYVSPVRDQGQCGSCYAFSSAGMLESRIRIASQNAALPILSTQDVVSCSFYSQGCEGGFPYLVAGKYGRDVGMLEEACYPYAGQDSACQPNPEPTCKPQRWRTSEYYYVGGYYGASTEQLMQAEILANGPISVSFEVYPDFMHYATGVYTHQFTRELVDTFNPFEITSGQQLRASWQQQQ